MRPNENENDPVERRRVHSEADPAPTTDHPNGPLPDVAECPAPETIAAYALGWAGKRTQDNIGMHLHYCPHCRIEVQGIREAAEDVLG